MGKRKLFNYKVIKNPHAKQPYHWICKASNGEIRHCSENYTTKQSAIDAVITEIRYRVKNVCTFEDLTGESEKVSKRIERVLA